MTIASSIDTARLPLLLNDLRLPTIARHRQLVAGRMSEGAVVTRNGLAARSQAANRAPATSAQVAKA